MRNDLNIVVIGAGSSSFGLETLSGLMTQKKLNGASLSLVDLNEKNLKMITSLAELANQQWKANLNINSTTDRSQVLQNADFVILSVAIDREKTWINDHKLAKKYGIWHYAENGGPGSFSHTVRGLAFIMPILNDIHDLAPKTWLLNYTNPVPRVGYASQHAKVKCIGLCHQIWHAYGIVGRYMSKDLKITDQNLLNFQFKWNDENFRIFNKIVEIAYKNYDIIMAGLNHFIWLMDIKRRENGEDIYALIHEGINSLNPQFEPLTQHMFRIFGYLPGPGDTHLSEYVPYTITKSNWEKYAIQLYDFDWAIKGRKLHWDQIEKISSGIIPFNIKPNSHERADWIIAEINEDTNSYEQSANIINDGAISNLPKDAIVEIPTFVGKQKARGMKVGPLPEAIAALCNREISVAKLMTKAGIEGDRNAAVQAFALDPMVNDLKKAEEMVDDYIATNRDYLPQFFKK